MFNCIDKSSASNKLHGYSGLFDSTARAFCLVQVWLPDLREIDGLRTISKGGKTARQFLDSKNCMMT